MVALERGRHPIPACSGRAANPRFEKQSAAMTLWKSEMLELVPEPGAERKPRRLLAQLIAETRRDLELSMSICDL